MTTLFLSACAILLAIVFCLLREIYWLKLGATLFEQWRKYEVEYRTSEIQRVKRTVDRYADVMEAIVYQHGGVVYEKNRLYSVLRVRGRVQGELPPYCRSVQADENHEEHIEIKFEGCSAEQWKKWRHEESR